MNNMEKGLHVLMNRSAMKGVVDPHERSKALGDDVGNKLRTIASAMGRDPVDAIKLLGSKV